MKKLILVFLACLFLLPAMYSLPEAKAQPTISEFTNCVSFFTRRVTAREGVCKFWEFEVTIEEGAQGPPGPPGEDGLDVMDICEDNEVLLANGTCLDLSALVPISCPCWNAGSDLGGIDFMIDNVNGIRCSPVTDDSINMVTLTPPPIWSVVWNARDASCTYIYPDFGFDLDNTVTNLSNQEIEACEDIVRNSRLFQEFCIF